ncbi:F-box/kelch-repeat protein At3g06240-like [Rhododendron vialii]|uniref:F-box/kelch-repeat protein At3g06240-like n=1 Tax=Rhododendron vialii TaxID=182163 RepID=UPI00265DC84C|nr:F-box/kelch-repeat protein At3g06240-like [Rhododendron vialii]
MKKKKTIMSNGDTNDCSIHRVPPEILADILSRLPVKFLCQLKCVSPSWNSLISSPCFAKTHLKRNPPSQKIILVCVSEDLYSVDFANANPAAKKLDFPSVQRSHHRWTEVLGSCNGLLLVSGKGYSTSLLNPTTRERKKLPTCPLSFSLEPYVYLHGFGHDSFTDDYKVVMLSYQYIKSYSKYYFDSDANITHVAVYSLKTDAWRRIQDSHYHPLGNPSGVHFNERLHWLCRRTGGSDGSKVIVAFDLSDEIFKEVQLPTSFSDYEIFYHHMAVLGGCLCVIVCPLSYRNEVWMMKEYGVRESWTKFMINPRMVLVDLLCLLAEDEFLMKTRGKEPDVLFQDKLVVYNLKKKTLRDMVVPDIQLKCQNGVTYGYVESLVSPNH